MDAQHQEILDQRPSKGGCINWQHLKVIMLKDRLILRRRKSCCISLLTLPPLFFFLATLQYILIDTNKISGELMTENFYYSTNQAQNITVQGAPLTIPASYLEGSVNMPSGASNVNLYSLFGGQPVTSLSKCYES